MYDSALIIYLTKLLPVFVSPLGLTLVLSASGLLLALYGARRLAFALVAISAAGLWIASAPAFADWALGALERQYPPQPVEALAPHDVAIVLGGALAAPVPPRVTVDLVSTSDRVLQAARLYRAGKVGRILVTGGNLPWETKSKPEAELIKELLVEWGVPPSAIETAGASRNTYENALEIRDMFAQRRFASALLVTSASHMPRALAVFRHAGVPVDPATTDIVVVRRGVWTLLQCLPDAAALQRTTEAMRERIGVIVYHARGYL